MEAKDKWQWVIYIGNLLLFSIIIWHIVPIKFYCYLEYHYYGMWPSLKVYACHVWTEFCCTSFSYWYLRYQIKVWVEGCSAIDSICYSNVHCLELWIINNGTVLILSYSLIGIVVAIFMIGKVRTVTELLKFNGTWEDNTEWNRTEPTPYTMYKTSIFVIYFNNSKYNFFLIH